MWVLISETRMGGPFSQCDGTSPARLEVAEGYIFTMRCCNFSEFRRKLTKDLAYTVDDRMRPLRVGFLQASDAYR